jgi:hypothetical protein
MEISALLMESIKILLNLEGYTMAFRRSILDLQKAMEISVFLMEKIKIHVFTTPWLSADSK